MGEAYNPQDYTWIQDYIWPRYESSFVRVSEEILADRADLSVQVSDPVGRKYPFVASAAFFQAEPGKPPRYYAAIYLNCGPYLRPGREDTQLICRSEIIRGSRDGTVVLDEGPRMLFSLGDNDRIRHGLDRWVVVTADFIEESSNTILRQFPRTQ